MKICKICKNEKTTDCFYKNSSSPDGLRAKCKGCEGVRPAEVSPDGSDKYCPGCEKVLLKNSFSLKKSSGDGLRSRCKDCDARDAAAWRKENPEKNATTMAKHAARRKRLYAEDPQYREKIKKINNDNWHAKSSEEKSKIGWANHLKRAYGLTLEKYNKILELQDGVCRCCLRESESYDVDHDHQTGKVRGIICRSCNQGIGNLGDDVDGLEMAIIYLETVSVLDKILNPS